MIQYSVWPWIIGSAFYVSGAVTFAHRFPEKWNPGKYDCCGSSHNIFHVLVLMGVAAHFYGSVEIYEHRL